ncbi:DNA adenine methylase [Ruficoccus amylovorans]|uniref:site-specific DNA-methyltransferase (adenine-specific) n=1 Tax=Ruficoccus amylovorans TaxID=1804625 RepID=A0A842HHI8_9BACT|nr:DNA adenine methylase [Ruficoccus amylovorans]MBC2594701.1 DNA adenine methylase [Ruficoccus amylovorans]
MLVSPLRYPGGKQSLAIHVETIIRQNLLNGCVFYEPYAGGSAITLSLLSNELISSAVLVEKDPLIYAFWKCVFEQPDGLCSLIKRTDVSVDTWRSMQRYMQPHAIQNYDLLSLGFAGLFLNRTNFSGIISANPIGGIDQQSRYKIDCRFNKDRIIDTILKISRYRKLVEVVYGDAIQVLSRRKRRLAKENVLVYIDPPYYVQGERLYRYSYDGLGHRRLAEFIDNQNYPWIVSIDSHPDILDFYKNQVIVPIQFNYVVRKCKKVDELLISNIPLDEISRCVIKSQDIDLGVQREIL